MQSLAQARLEFPAAVGDKPVEQRNRLRFRARELVGLVNMTDLEAGRVYALLGNTAETAYLALASHSTSAAEIFVICLSLALGLQNAAFRRTGGISVHTTYLTGMITGLLATEAEKLVFQAPPHRATEPDAKFWFLCGIWAVFVFGAAIGAAAALHFKEPGILGAALVLLAIIVRNSVVASRAQLAG